MRRWIARIIHGPCALLSERDLFHHRRRGRNGAGVRAVAPQEVSDLAILGHFRHPKIDGLSDSLPEVLGLITKVLVLDLAELAAVRPACRKWLWALSAKAENLPSCCSCQGRAWRYIHFHRGVAGQHRPAEPTTRPHAGKPDWRDDRAVVPPTAIPVKAISLQQPFLRKRE